MRSTFYGLEIAKTGLFAAQRSIDLTGHNIANANTVGYTRQRLMQSPQELVSGGEHLREITRGYSGMGVRVDGVEQVRDNYLDQQYRQEDCTLEMWSARSDALGYIQQLFRDSSDSGLSSSIGQFFTSLQILTEAPESKEYRMNVLQSATLLTSDFQHIAAQLVDKQTDMNETVSTTVMKINDIAWNIAALNDRIFNAELGNNQKANDLRDQRNNLLDTLAGLTDISYTEDATGMVDVTIGGDLLVDGTTANLLQTTATHVNPIAGLGLLYDVEWAATGNPLTVTGGKLRATLDMRDGNTAANIGIPYIMSRLDTLADGITKAVNAVHQGGYTFPDVSNGNVSVNGVNFFTDTGAPVTALNFSVDAAILASVYNIAAAGNPVTGTTNADNDNALKLVQLQDSLTLPIIGSIDGYEKGLTAEIALETSHTNTMRDNQQFLTDSLQNQRMSISGVSVDEEMTNLVKYQHAYDASARVITAIDEYLDTIINKLGIVGR